MDYFLEVGVKWVVMRDKIISFMTIIVRERIISYITREKCREVVVLIWATGCLL